jgi:hypothetical protein
MARSDWLKTTGSKHVPVMPHVTEVHSGGDENWVFTMIRQIFRTSNLLALVKMSAAASCNNKESRAVAARDHTSSKAK